MHTLRRIVGGGGLAGGRGSRMSLGAVPTLPRFAIPHASQAAPHSCLCVEFPCASRPVLRWAKYSVCSCSRAGLRTPHQVRGRTPRSDCCGKSPVKLGLIAGLDPWTPHIFNGARRTGGGGGAWHAALDLLFLSAAAPTSRSPFTTLPFPCLE